MDRVIAHVKKLYPKAHYVAIADGASDNWRFLNPYTTGDWLSACHAVFIGCRWRAISKKALLDEKQEWMDDRCHRLRHMKGAAGRILNELREAAQQIEKSTHKTGTKRGLEKLNKAISYFTNQKSRMGYYAMVNAKPPSGSGVTEAACKLVAIL